MSAQAAKLGAEIKRQREKLNLSLEAAAGPLSISAQSISNVEAGYSNPDDPRTRRTIQRLAELYGNTFGLPWIRLKTSAGHEIRIEGRVAAGRPIEFLEQDETISVDPAHIKLSGEVTALRVFGESMVDQHILNGDVLICRKGTEPRKGTIVVVDLKGERGAAVKRWERKGDMVYLFADRYAKPEDKQAFHDWEVGKVFEIIGLIRSIK